MRPRRAEASRTANAARPQTLYGPDDFRLQNSNAGSRRTVQKDWSRYVGDSAVSRILVANPFASLELRIELGRYYKISQCFDYRRRSGSGCGQRFRSKPMTIQNIISVILSEGDLGG